MAENIDAWWERRQRSKGRPVPYAVGTFREDWAPFPMLIRQYHSDFNRGITLTQIPPAAEVYLVWQCDTGHIFVATPEEQRSRPAGRRRRSVWCPVCRDLANPPRIRPAPIAPIAPASPTAADTATATATREAPSRAPGDTAIRTTPSPAAGPSRGGRDRGSGRGGERSSGGRAVGTAFWSAVAPKPASAAEALLRQKLGARLEVDLRPNAVAVGRPFHDRREVWPDFVLDEFRVAIEYDTVGRFGLEHVGPREESDRAKDRLLREAGWEVIRIRCRPLRPLGRWDLEGTAVTDRLVERLIDRLGELRGELLVAAYGRPAGPHSDAAGDTAAKAPAQVEQETASARRGGAIGEPT